MDHLGGRLQLFVAEGDGLVKHRRHHVVTRLRQVGIEVHLGPLGQLKRIGITRRHLTAHGRGRQDGQARNLRVQQQHLAFQRDTEADEFLGFLGVLAARHQADVGRHHRCHIGVNKLHRKARVLARQTKEVDHQAHPKLPVVHAVGHAETALGDLRGVARDFQQLAPAFFPALALQHGLHREVGRARARGRAECHMVEIRRLHQIGPLLGRGHLVGLHVARVPHQAVASKGLPQVEALWVVDRVVAHLGWCRLVGQIRHVGQQVQPGQDLKRIGCRSPENVGPLAHRQLAHIGDALRGVLVQDLQLDARVRLFERGLVNAGEFLGERGHHRHRAGAGRQGQGQGQGGPKVAEFQRMFHRCLQGFEVEGSGCWRGVPPPCPGRPAHAPTVPAQRPIISCDVPHQDLGLARMRAQPGSWRLCAPSSQHQQHQWWW